MSKLIPFEELDELCNSLFVGERPDLADCLAAAADVSAYVQAVCSKAVVAATYYLGDAIHALGARAREGDIRAIKTLLEVVGLYKKAPEMMVNTQINLRVPTVGEFMKQFSSEE